MKNYFLSLCTLFIILSASCTFTETIVIKADGSGEATVLIDASELMVFEEEGGENINETINFNEFLEEHKDSIALLPKADRERLSAMKDYRMSMVANFETSELLYSMFTRFSKISEANNLFSNFTKLQDIITGAENQSEEEVTDFIKVNYSFDNKTFKRASYVSDRAAHQRQMDSLQEAAMILENSTYKVNYTFPRKIASASNKSAQISGNNIALETSFYEYLSNPEIMDIEVTLED